MLRFWDIRRATGIGVMAGLAALVLWPLYAAYQDPLLWPFVGALAVTAFCGLSLLILTFKDMYRRTRGRLMQRIRIFDVILGLLLAVPSLAQLEALLG
jgi:drug/metabolite transporter (DMT)-like permease